MRRGSRGKRARDDYFQSGSTHRAPQQPLKNTGLFRGIEYHPMAATIWDMHQEQEALRVERVRGGRYLFHLGPAAASEIASALQKALQKDPSAFGAHIPHLIERIRERQPLTIGDASQVFRLRAQVEGLSPVGERAISLFEPALRDAQERLVLRNSYFRSPRSNAA